MVFRCFLLSPLLSEVSPSAGFIDPHRLMARTQNYGLEEHNQQVLLLPSPGDPGTLHLYVLSPKPARFKVRIKSCFYLTETSGYLRDFLLETLYL